MSQDTAAQPGQGAESPPQLNLERFDKFFGGLAPGESQDPGAPEAKEEAPPPAPPAPPEPEKPAPPAPEARSSLADKIRADREAREARARETQQAQSLQTELSAARARIAELEAQQAPEDDIIAYARSRNWDRKKQAMIGEMLLYDLVPDQATPEVRQRLFETKQSLREREAAEKAQAEAQTRARAEAESRIQAYQQIMVSAAETFEPGAYPESEDHFGDDRSSYLESLMVTANNMAVAAQSAGRAVDLSPGNVARTLEAAIAERQARRDARRGARNQERKPAGDPTPQSGGGKLPAVLSTQDLSEGRGARPKAQTDDERLARAAEVVFGKK